MACGLPDAQLTCVNEQRRVLGYLSTLTMDQVVQVCAEHFAHLFNYVIQPTPKSFIDYVPMTLPNGRVILDHVVMGGEQFDSKT
mgnify:FL=1